jgi:hypothetical protein
MFVSRPAASFNQENYGHIDDTIEALRSIYNTLSHASKGNVCSGDTRGRIVQSELSVTIYQIGLCLHRYLLTAPSRRRGCHFTHTVAISIYNQGTVWPAPFLIHFAVLSTIAAEGRKQCSIHQSRLAGLQEFAVRSYPLFSCNSGRFRLAEFISYYM